MFPSTAMYTPLQIPYDETKDVQQIYRPLIKLSKAVDCRSITGPTENTLRNYLTETMLGLIAHTSQTALGSIVYTEGSYTTSKINSQCKPENLGALPGSSFIKPTDLTRSLEIIYVTSGRTLIPKFDEYFTEAKPISMMLQQNTAHIIRVYKLQLKGAVDSYVIFTSEYSLDFLRKIIAILPLIMPSLGIPEEVLPIFKAFGGDNYELYKELIKEYLKNTDIEDNAKITALTQAFSCLNDRAKADVQRAINTTTSKIDAYEHSIRELYIQRQNLLQQQLTLTLSDTLIESLQDSIKYLCKHPAITDIEIQNKDIVFTVHHALKYYDVEVLQKLLDRQNVSSTPFYGKPELAKLFEKVFITNELDFNMTTRFRWDLIGLNVSRDENLYDLTSYSQPHIMRFNCWGSNMNAINKSLTAKDFITAFEQCLASCYNINFTDITVLRNFIEQIMNSNSNGILIKDTDESITFREFKNRLLEPEPEPDLEPIPEPELTEEEEMEQNRLRRLENLARRNGDV